MIRRICSTISRKSLECLSLKSIFQAAFKLLSDLLKRKLFYRSDVIDHFHPHLPGRMHVTEIEWSQSIGSWLVGINHVEGRNHKN